MKLSLYCPTCAKPITDLRQSASPFDGTGALRETQVTCPSCQRHYGIVHGKLSQRSSIQEALLHLTSKLPSFYKRHYTFQITTADRNLKNLQFSIPGKADVVPVQRGDMVSVLYTMQGYVMERLVAIANHTTGKNYILPSPIPSTSRRATVLIGAAVASVLLAFFSGFSLVFTAMLNALGIWLYLKLTHSAQLSSTPLENQAIAGKRLLADQQLIVQQQRIRQRIQELIHECQANGFLIEQLETLKQKMASVDSALYSARIYRATSAVKILKQQIANNRRLIREYERTLKMIEIEIETSWIADQLPDVENFTRKILDRLSELKEIEEQNQTLKLQLSAYEDVNLHRIEEYSEK